MDYLSLNAEQSRVYFDRMVDVYQVAFAQPPYNESFPDILNFAARLPFHALNPGFVCVVAHNDTTKALAGFVYGYAGSQQNWWYRMVSPGFTPEVTEKWLGDYFELAELAVDPSWQGQGIGGQLHDRLLAELPYRTAALSTSQAETNALHLYRCRGWVSLLEHFHFPGDSMEYRIMGKEL